MIQTITSAQAWKIAAAACALVAAFSSPAWAVNDTGWLWTFENATTNNTAQTTPPLGPFANEVGFGGSATGLHASAATVWSTPVGNGSAKSLSSNNFTAGDYYEFTLTDTLTLNNLGIQFDQVSSTTGPRDWILQYSLNGTTFNDFASYAVGPNATPAWSSAGAVAPVGLDTYDFNLTSVTGLNNSANPITFRMTVASPIVAAQMGSTPAAAGTDRVDNVRIMYNYDPGQPPVTPPDPTPVSPITADVVFGIGSGRKETTMELVRGTAVLNGGTKPTPYSKWTAQNFVRFVKFDNVGGALHNVNGNLLALDPGGSATAGGNVYSYGTQGSNPAPAPQLLATTNTLSGAATRLGGLSVAPNNAKIALAGFDTGKVLVYNYTAGNGLGTGSPSLTGLQQTATAILGTGANYSAGNQQGTAWKDNNTVLAFAGDGKLYTVDATTMATNNVQTVTLTTATNSITALAYNPNVSPYLYATYSSFVTTGSVTTNKLFVFDPNAAYAELTGGGLDFSTSAFQIRDIALGAGGNLFISTAGSSGGGQGRIEYIPGVGTPGSITANSSVDWYLDEVFGGVQNGLDIAFAPPAGLTGDFNSDGKVDAGDYVTWRKNEVANLALANDNGVGNQAARFDLWRANFGNPPGAGSGLNGAAVPEPTSALLLLVGIVGLGLRRRSA
jgi:PEP-CTERM motif